MELKAKHARLMDLNSGSILFDKGGDSVAFPASMTKLVTALFAISVGQVALDQIITISGHVDDLLSAHDAQMGLVSSEKISFDSLLHGLLLPSANDAANAIAEHVSGSILTFVEQLNEFVKKLGCQQTFFMNPNGLHHSKHLSSAADMCLILKAVLEQPRLKQIIAKPYFICPETNKHPKRRLEQLNLLVVPTSRYFNERVIGGKTGHHRSAHWCVVAAATKEQKTLIACVMGSDNNASRFKDATKLFDYGFGLKALVN